MYQTVSVTSSSRPPTLKLNVAVYIEPPMPELWLEFIFAPAGKSEARNASDLGLVAAPAATAVMHVATVLAAMTNKTVRTFNVDLLVSASMPRAESALRATR